MALRKCFGNSVIGRGMTKNPQMRPHDQHSCKHIYISRQQRHFNFGIAFTPFSRLQNCALSIGTSVRTLRTCSVVSSKHIFSYSNIDYIVYVKTGDQLQAGTDANVSLVFHGENGERSDPVALDYIFRDDFERGQLDTFQIKNLGHLKDINKIEIWRDNAGFASNWFVDYIEVEDVGSRRRFMFPVFRWIRENRHYVIRHMDNCLPQFDPEAEHRADELEYKQSEYQCSMKIAGGPTQLTNRDLHKRKEMDPVDYIFCVRTGDRKNAGTDANVKVILHGDGKRQTDKIRLHNVFKNDFERGNLDTFLAKKHFKLRKIEKLELWRDNFGLGSQWYVNYITVRRSDQETEYAFPIFRWIPAKTHFIFRLNDTMLPQTDPEQEQRWNEIKYKRSKYIITQKIEGGPAQVSDYM